MPDLRQPASAAAHASQAVSNAELQTETRWMFYEEPDPAAYAETRWTFYEQPLYEPHHDDAELRGAHAELPPAARSRNAFKAAAAAASDRSGNAAAAQSMAGQPPASLTLQVGNVTAAVTAAVEAAAAGATAIDVGLALGCWDAMQEQLTAAASAIGRLLSANGIPERQFTTSAPARSGRAADDDDDIRCSAKPSADSTARCEQRQASFRERQAKELEHAKRVLAERRYALRVAALGGAVLSDETVLQRILDCVGPQSYLQIATVCSEWKAEYHEACSRFERRSLARPPCDLLAHSTAVEQSLTAYSQAFASTQLLHMTAASGTLDLSLSSAQYSAGRHGNIAVLRLAHDEFGMPFTEAVVQGAVRSGCAVKFDWLRAQYTSELPDDTAELAARSGSISILQQLLQEGLVHTESAALQAIEGGHLHTLQFLHSEGCSLDSQLVQYTATSCGDAAIFKWLHSVGCIQLNARMAETAARSGSVELMQYLQQHGILPDDRCMRAALDCCDLAMCKHLHTAGCEWVPEYTTEVLRSWRTLDILEWALTLGVELTPEQQSDYAQCNFERLSYA
jgi:hypothetical protein